MKLIGKLKKKISLNHIQGFDSLFRSNLTNAIQRVRTFNKTIDHIVEMEDNTDSLLFGDISPCQVETVARLTVDLLISLTVTHSEVKRIENDLGRYCFVFTKKLLNDANQISYLDYDKDDIYTDENAWKNVECPEEKKK